MEGARSTSSIQNAAIIARVQAIAPRRAAVTAASCAELRSRITLDEDSYSEKTFISSERNARRCCGDNVARCDFISAPIIVSSTDGGGMSSTVEGGKPAYSGMVPPDFAPQGSREIIERGNPASRNTRFPGVALAAKECPAFRPQLDNVPHPICRRENRFSPVGGRGPAVDGTPDTIASGGANPFPHAENAGLARASFRSLPVLAGAPLKGRRNPVRLSPGFAFAPRCAGQPLVTPDHHPTPCPEVHVNDLAHLSVLKSHSRLEASQ